MKTVEFIFDFGSPNAYLAHRVIPAVEARTGAAFTYNPCLLGGIFKATGNRSPFEHFAGVRNKLDYERLEIRRFVERHHIDAFRMNSVTRRYTFDGRRRRGLQQLFQLSPLRGFHFLESLELAAVFTQEHREWQLA